MGDATRASCKRCGGHRDDVGEISWEGYCRPCGRAVLHANNEQMVDRRGPNWNRWRRGMILAAGGAITDPKLRV